MKRYTLLYYIHTGIVSILCAVLPLASLLSACSAHMTEDNGVATATVTQQDEEISHVISTELSNQQITGFAEDADGYMWIATHRGLNRYNGYDFHQYYCTDDSTTLPDNQLTFVYNDSRNRLWVGSVNGVCYRTDDDRFRRVHIKDNTSHNGIQMVENSKGRLFLNIIGSFLIFDEEAGGFLEEVQLGTDSYTMRLYVDDNDKLWAVSGMTIKTFDSNTLTPEDSIPLDHYMRLSCRMGNEIWMYDSGEFRIYDMKQHSFKPVPTAITSSVQLRNSSVNCLSSHDDNIVSLYTYNGVFVYDKSSNTLSHQSDKGFDVASDEFFASLTYTDKKGNLWLGSPYQGFAIRNAEKMAFNSNTALTALMRGKSVQSVINDGHDNLWIATTYNGLYHYNTDTYEVQHYDIEKLLSDRHGNGHYAYSLYIDRDGYLWACLSGNSVAKFAYEDKKLRLLKSYDVFMPLNIYEDSNGTMWIGTYSDYIYTMARSEDRFTTHSALNAPFSYTSLITELKDGTAVGLTWMVGMQTLNPDKRKMEWTETMSSQIQGALRRSIFLPTCLLEDSKGHIWLGTVANGILLYSPESQTVERVNGLPCTDVCSMEEDNEGRIWVSTMNGMSLLDPSTLTFKTFYAFDGLAGNQFFDRASCRLGDGTLVFGGNSGLTIFLPSIAVGAREQKLQFEDLKIHNNVVLPSADGIISQRLSRTPDINLDYTDNEFSISYAAIDYSVGNQQVRYQYRLEGFDHYWVDANTGREAYYANLPAGNYTFHVKATNGQGDAVGQNSIRISVAPAPWRTWWAYTLYAATLMALAWFIIDSYIRVKMSRQNALQSEREKEHERNINRMNMNFFANVSHEFRTPLTIISGPIEQLCADTSIDGESKHLLYIVQNSVRRMLRLVNQLLEFHKLENDTLKLTVRKEEITALLQQFTDIFTVNGREKNIGFNIYGLEDSFMGWVDADKLEKITANLLSNAFKFTPSGGRIIFSFDVITRQEAAASFPLTDKDTDTQYVKICVKDSGCGIPKGEEEQIFGRYYQLDKYGNKESQIGTGIGLNYAQSLVTLHHGYIKAENRSDGQQGSVFSFVLPVNESSYCDSEKKTSNEQKVLFPLQDYNINGACNDGDIADNRKKILVVDDDIDIVGYMRTMLSGDYHVVSCFDAQSGLKLMQEDAPDLVISDVLMPETNGYEFCRQIKENIQLCHIPVILVTAKATTENQIDGLKSGADAYVVKPFAPSYLMALIHSLLQNREKARQILVKSTQTAEVPQDILLPQDKNLMDEVYSIMEKELSNPELDVSHMTEMLHISRTKLYYKIKGLTGMNPSVFFRCYKLNRAAELIKEGKYNISEISYMTGFNTLSHFSTSFKKQFGVNPSEYK